VQEDLCGFLLPQVRVQLYVRKGTALLWECRALLWECRAVLRRCRAILRISRALCRFAELFSSQFARKDGWVALMGAATKKTEIELLMQSGEDA